MGGRDRRIETLFSSRFVVALRQVQLAQKAVQLGFLEAVVVPLTDGQPLFNHSVRILEPARPSEGVAKMAEVIGQRQFQADRGAVRPQQQLLDLSPDPLRRQVVERQAPA